MDVIADHTHTYISINLISLLSIIYDEEKCNIMITCVNIPYQVILL